MAKFLNTIFVIILILPLSALLFFRIEAYGQRPFSNVPSLNDLASDPSPDNIKRLLDAAFERSIVTREAIAAKNTFRYQLTGDLDSPTTIQGYGGWLFFKGQFKNGRCYTESDIQVGARGLEILHAMGAEVGLDITVGVSPNKSTMFPENLNPRFSKFYGCIEQNSQTIDEAYVDRFDFVRSSKPILLAAKERNLPIYYPTDTHWTDLGAVLATFYLPGFITEEGMDWDDIRENLRYKDRENDLSNLMGLVGKSTKVDTISAAYVDTLKDTFDLPYSNVIGDSFMRQSHNLGVFEDIDWYQTNWGTAVLVEKVRNAKGPILLDSVEREFVSRTVQGYLSPKSNIMKGVLARHGDQFTDRCDVDAGPISPIRENVIRTESVGSSGRQFTATTTDPQHFLELDEPLGTLCMSARINTSRKGVLEVYLPPLSSGDTQFEKGRVIPLTLDPKAPDSQVNILFPSSIQSNSVRIDPVNFTGPYSLDEVTFYRKRSESKPSINQGVDEE